MPRKKKRNKEIENLTNIVSKLSYLVLLMCVVVVCGGIYFYFKTYKIDNVINNTELASTNVATITSNLSSEKISGKEAIEIAARAAVSESINQFIDRGPEIIDNMTDAAVDGAFDIGEKATKKAINKSVSVVKNGTLGAWNKVSNYFSYSEEIEDPEIELEPEIELKEEKINKPLIENIEEEKEHLVPEETNEEKKEKQGFLAFLKFW